MRQTGPDAVVVGLELNGLGLTRALWKRNVRCFAIAEQHRSPVQLTRSVAGTIRCRSWSEDALIEALLKMGRRLRKKAVLFLTKDEAVMWVSKRRAELEQYYHCPLPPDPVVRLLINKGSFVALAREQGWPVPLTWDVESADDLERILPLIPFPCILKPKVRNEVYRRQSVPKAFKLFDIDSVRKTYQLVSQWEREVVVSEFIEGPDSQLVSCRGYWANGAPLAHFVVRKLLQWPVQTGNMALAEPAPADWCEEAMAIADRVFRHVGFTGMGAMEFKRRADGSLAIMEPAVGRTIYSSEIAPLNGVDLPWVYYAHAAFGIDTPIPGYLTGRPQNGVFKQLTDLPREVLSAQTYIARGEMTKDQWRSLRVEPVCEMLWRPEDPMPFLASRCSAMASEAKGVVRKLVGDKMVATARAFAGGNLRGTVREDQCY